MKKSTVWRIKKLSEPKNTNLLSVDQTFVQSWVPAEVPALAGEVGDLPAAGGAGSHAA